jgi:carotenoid 1,2-hydratase
VSDDGELAIVVIALLGNPFSPAYARARRGGPANALDFSSMNVAIYGRVRSAWALAERRVTDGDRTAHGVAIGASSMRWDGDRLVVDIDERTTPFGRRLRGRVIVHPEATTGLVHPIDARGEHSWWPIAPLARISVDLPQPGVRFTGHGYHDANAGDVPIPDAFERWSWSRGRTGDGAALLTYDVALRDGRLRTLAFEVSSRGEIADLPHTWRAPLAPTAWGLARRARVDAGEPARVVRVLEDGPFYARALVETRLGGRGVVAMHEELAAHRLRRLWVRFLTGFRMRRAT